MVEADNAISSLHEVGRLARSSKTTKRWLLVRNDLDSLARQRNLHEFDETFMRYLNSCSKSTPSHNSKEHGIPTQKTRDHFAPARKQRFISEACYVLRMMFSFRSDKVDDTNPGPSQSSIRLNSFSPNIFRWLVFGNYLTPELLLKALQPEESLYTQSTKIIEDGDIIKAVLAYNSDLHVLDIILENPFTLSILDIILAIKAILSTFNNHNLHLLRSNNDINRRDMEIEMIRQQEAAYSDIDRGLAILELGSDMRGIMLQRALTRLQSFGSVNVSQYLRQHLQKYELFFLLRLLRIEITEGGWTLRYTESEMSEAGYSAPDEQAMSVILGLMSSVINALGIAGWLADSSEKDDDNADELLLMLQAEISHVLEGVTEATFMAGLLDEFLRYGSRTMTKPKYCRSSHIDSQADAYQQIRKSPAKKYTGEKLLLLGSEANMLSQETKRGIRGEIKKRSRREIGMQLSMKRTKYSRERIRI